MDKISLGTTSLEITRLGFGGCPLGGHGWGHCDQDELVQAVRQARDLGINFFDTADIYGLGHSEELLSEVLGKERHELVIASKFGVRCDAPESRTYKDTSPKYVRQALTASLKRLRLEAIPLYYVHWPDGITPIRDTVAEMEKCRQEGKIRAIGLSNVTVAEIQQALDVAPVDAVQVQYSLIDRDMAELLFDIVTRNKITLVTWGSLAQGLLTGKYDENSTFEESDRRSRDTYTNFHGERLIANMKIVRRLKALSEEIGKTPSQIAIRWLLDTKPVGSVLCGVKTREQVENNLGAIGWSIPSHFYEMLSLMGETIAT